MIGVLSAFWPVVLSLTAQLQAVPASVPPGSDPAPIDTAALTIALLEKNDRMTVPVQIANAGPYRFVIDTGSERTVISRELAGRLGLVAGRPVNVTAMSGTTRVGTVVIPSLQLSDVPAVGEIQAPALGALDLGALGLLGIDTLRDHKVVINFDGQTMQVTPSAKRSRHLPAARDEIVVRAKSLLGQLIVTDAEFEGSPIRVVIDTGSPVSIGNLAMKRLVSRHSYKVEPLEMTSATGGKVQTQYALVNKIQVGRIEFNAMPVAFADVAPFEKFGLDRRPAMLLGMNSLKFFRQVDIDFANREIRFKKPRGDRMAQRCTTSINGNCTN